MTDALIPPVHPDDLGNRAVSAIRFTGKANNLAKDPNHGIDYQQHIGEAERGDVEIVGHEDGAPYTLEINVEQRGAIRILFFRQAAEEVTNDPPKPVFDVTLTDRTFFRNIRDYAIKTEVYYTAVRGAPVARLQQIDTEKRELHTKCTQHFMTLLGPDIRFRPNERLLVARSMFALCMYALR